MKTKGRMARLAAVVRMFVCALAWSALAQDCPELAGRWPYGPTIAVELSGGYVYTGSGAVLRVIDVSEPGAPRVVGEVALYDRVSGVAVTDGIAYVANETGGLRIVDVSAPSLPFEVAVFDSYGSDVAVSGGYAYLAAGIEGLQVIDVHDLSSPRLVAHLTFFDDVGPPSPPSPSAADAIALAGDIAYVGTAIRGLRVIDVSTPTSPKRGLPF